MTLTDIIAIAAVLLSPLVALQVSEALHRRREKRQRQLHVFRTLMSTRASGLAPEHVQSLNMIDIEFHGSDTRSKAVLNAWKAYLDHLNTLQTDSTIWGSRREDLFVDLLYEMSRYLGYEFDKTHIRRTSYFPVGYGDLESDQYTLRKGLVRVLTGQTSFPIVVTGVAQPEGSDSPPEETRPPQLPSSA